LQQAAEGLCEQITLNHGVSKISDTNLIIALAGAHTGSPEPGQRISDLGIRFDNREGVPEDQGTVWSMYKGGAFGRCFRLRGSESLSYKIASKVQP
jgi:hypothetical protein